MWVQSNIHCIYPLTDIMLVWQMDNKCGSNLQHILTDYMKDKYPLSCNSIYYLHVGLKNYCSVAVHNMQAMRTQITTKNKVQIRLIHLNTLFLSQTVCIMKKFILFILFIISQLAVPAYAQDAIYQVNERNKSKYFKNACSTLENFYVFLIESRESSMKENFVERMMLPETALSPDFYYKNKVNTSFIAPNQYILEFEKEYRTQLEEVDELLFEVSDIQYDANLYNPQNDEHAAYLKVVYNLQITFKGETLKRGRNYAVCYFPDRVDYNTCVIKQLMPVEKDFAFSQGQVVSENNTTQNTPTTTTNLPASNQGSYVRVRSTDGDSYIMRTGYSKEAFDLLKKGKSSIRKFQDLKARDYFLQAAEAGSMDAYSHLGDLYYNGGNEIKRVIKTAYNYYRKAANAGVVNAQYMVGICYRNGEGPEKNRQLAKVWISKAAKQGHQKAQKILEKL